MNTAGLSAAYRTMRLIRSFEETVVTLVNTNEIPGVTHEYIGQEAVAVGMCSALTDEDVITSTHRGHGHLIARGADTGRMLAELMAREGGLNRGRGGSMHVADVSLGIYGANGIVGAGAPFAAGACSVPGPSGPRVGVAFFGDGAINQGVLLETMNLAAAWRLPMVFCCENNGYAVTTPAAVSGLTDPAERATGFGIPSRTVDGMDVEAVSQAAHWAANHARSGNGPVLLNCLCYRYVGHNTGEHTLGLSYRSEDEINGWRARDPLVVAAARLVDEHESPAQTVNDLDESVVEQMRVALDFAHTSDHPDAASALDFMYATPTLETATRWGTR